MIIWKKISERHRPHAAEQVYTSTMPGRAPTIPLDRLTAGVRSLFRGRGSKALNGRLGSTT
jgi:hypothetical protein